MHLWLFHYQGKNFFSYYVKYICDITIGIMILVSTLNSCELRSMCAEEAGHSKKAPILAK